MYAVLLSMLLGAQCVLARSANSTNPTNSTLAGTSSGNTLYCQPTKWYNVFLFLVGNYISHVLTVKSYPGEATPSFLIAALGALFIPTTGLIRGINAIARNAKFKRKRFWQAVFRNPDYQTAAAAGGLCMVVRKKSWKPYPGDKLFDVVLREESEPVKHSKWNERKISWAKGFKAPYFFYVEPMSRKVNSPETRKTLKIYRAPWTQERGKYWGYTDTAEEYVHPSTTIHGYQDFKDQSWSYALAHVPRDAMIVLSESAANLTPRRLEAAATGLSQGSRSTGSDTSSIARAQSLPVSKTIPFPIIAASYSIPKALIAIAQLAYAIVTLYQSRGKQIEHYGFAAFALTVVPYALMSLINLVGNMVTPDYQALYLVSSDVMDEAIRRGARFDGVVGRLVQDTDECISAEVVSSEKDEKNAGTVFLYRCNDSTKTLPVSVVDYSTPSSLSNHERRQKVKKLLQSLHEDLSPSIFIPTCSKFLRLSTHIYPTNTNRLQITPQGAFSFSTVILSTTWRTLTCILNAGVVLAIVGGISRFSSGESSVSQANWIMHWYTLGTVYSGFAIGDTLQTMPWPEPDVGEPSKWDIGLMLLPCVFYGIPAIGGFVTVIHMMYQWGTCTSF